MHRHTWPGSITSHFTFATLDDLLHTYRRLKRRHRTVLVHQYGPTSL
jgi:hypothetical protein